MTKKRILLLTSLLLIGIGGYYWYSQIKVPYDNAVTTFTKEKEVVEKKNNELNKEIENAQKSLDSTKQPLNEQTLTDLQIAISEAKETTRKTPDTPKKIEEVEKETMKLKQPLDYANEIKNLKDKTEAVENSFKQLAQITNPTEDFIILKLQQLADIGEIAPVTEENDPNGNLNKAGGYTATVYFSHKNVNKEDIFGSDLIDKGTDAGGSIEVYPTEEDAYRRNDYLSGFDGSALSSGSHTVIGTLVVRTSDKLTATQQKELEKDLIKVLTSLE
ncbi:EbhA [Vagococcus lutrae]|uniref:EbhA n=1 Tax=Vagococcus lutrae TaxID=81947 RepID=UPI0020970EC6|nr:EbhA [Vagococcus lutrae]MCO7150658.1 EbhA [Vagococcus lutrae]MDT2812195.1 EbhA [Vagococcus lutrae]MDT2818486.1 EbhA [Vagococcus lutrae]MDT2843450.1 EbhA [Vagococcus lutrae]WCG05226.1 EbhA [Vagococcus lutrae]